MYGRLAKTVSSTLAIQSSRTKNLSDESAGRVRVDGCGKDTRKVRKSAGSLWSECGISAGELRISVGGHAREVVSKYLKSVQSVSRRVKLTVTTKITCMNAIMADEIGFGILGTHLPVCFLRAHNGH